MDFDIVIVGGGLVGKSLAHALKDLPLRVAIVEKQIHINNPAERVDPRTLVLSYSSYKIFQSLGLWSELNNYITPIMQIHISDKGHFGKTRLKAKEEGVEALGFVIEFDAVNNTLQDSLENNPNIKLFCPAEIKDIQQDSSGALVKLKTEQGEETLSAKLVIAADGSDSTVRKLLNIEATQKEYSHSAIVGNVNLNRKHDNIAFERFTKNGPLAMLPFREKQAAMVWSVKNNEAEEIMSLNDKEFICKLQEQFGYRMGKIESLGHKGVFPLKLVRAKEIVKQNVVLIGSAANSLHPIAAQGFNLGLRDVAALSQLITEAVKDGQEINTSNVLQAYKRSRRSDQSQKSAFTDSVPRIFSNNFYPAVFGRNVGLMAVDLLPRLKRFIAKRSMGLSGKVSKLVRGLKD